MPCCTCKPRYKRRTDAIYPEAPGEGVDRAALQQFVWFSASNPAKLPKIGRYLHEQIVRDVNRRRTELVDCSLQAFDALVEACHAELRLFAEPYLQAIHNVMESQTPALQVQAVASLRKFLRIDGEGASYSRHLADFVAIFCAMCFQQSDDDDSVRVAGLSALRALLARARAKTGLIDLMRSEHLDKMMPAFIHTIQLSRARSAEDNPSSRTSRRDSEAEDAADPASLAVTCLKDVVRAASLNTMSLVLRPVFRHMSSGGFWQHATSPDITQQQKDQTADGEATLVDQVFDIIAGAVEDRFAHALFSELLQQLNRMLSEDGGTAQDRAGVVEVMRRVLSKNPSASTGPALLDTFNVLLQNLREDGQSGSCKALEQSVVALTSELSSSLSLSQKVDVIGLALGKLHTRSGTPARNTLRVVGSVARHIKSGSVRTVVPDHILRPLLGASESADQETAVYALSVLHHMLHLTADEPSSLDAIFPIMLVGASIDANVLQLTATTSGGTVSTRDMQYLASNIDAILRSMDRCFSQYFSNTPVLTAMLPVLVALAVHFSPSTIQHVLHAIVGWAKTDLDAALSLLTAVGCKAAEARHLELLAEWLDANILAKVDRPGFKQILSILAPAIKPSAKPSSPSELDLDAIAQSLDGCLQDALPASDMQPSGRDLGRIASRAKSPISGLGDQASVDATSDGGDSESAVSGVTAATLKNAVNGALDASIVRPEDAIVSVVSSLLEEKPSTYSELQASHSLQQSDDCVSLIPVSDSVVRPVYAY